MKKRTAKPREMETLLWDSAKAGNLADMESALKKGVEVDAADRDGASALVHASAHGHADAVRFLLNRGADVELKTRGGNTALSFAAYNGHAGAVDLLLKAGASIHATMATPAGRIPVLVFAAGNGYREVVDLFLKHGASLNIKKADVSPLNLAVESGNVKMVKFLLARGADVNGRQVLRHATPIMEAHRCPGRLMIRTLVRAGADVNKRDKVGMTVLMFAACGNRKAAVEELLAAGADPNITYVDPNGAKTAYDMAHQRGYHEVAGIIHKYMEKQRRQSRK